MRSTPIMLAVLTSTLLISACGPQPTSPAASVDGEEAASAAAGEGTAAAPSLREIMVVLAQDAAQLNDAIWIEDYDTVAAAADNIAGHPNVSPEQRIEFQDALGPEFADFVKSDQRVHNLALQLAEAGRGQDMDQVLSGYAELQRECVACHTAFRDRLTDQ